MSNPANFGQNGRIMPNVNLGEAYAQRRSLNPPAPLAAVRPEARPFLLSRLPHLPFCPRHSSRPRTGLVLPMRSIPPADFLFLPCAGKNSFRPPACALPESPSCLPQALTGTPPGDTLLPIKYSTCHDCEIVPGKKAGLNPRRAPAERRRTVKGARQAVWEYTSGAAPPKGLPGRRRWVHPLQ